MLFLLLATFLSTKSQFILANTGFAFREI